VQRNAGITTSRGKKWEWRHSLWILWTFTLGLFSWLAFAYIGIRGRRPRWLLWAVFYAIPVIFFAVIASSVSQSWTNATLNFNALFSVVSIVHAFRLRKEYLLRLDLIKRETGNVSVTSQGRRWEWLHSLWMLWTLTLGFFSWIAFFYIAFRARRPRWLVWGTLYFAAFLAFAVLTGYENRGGEIATGLMIVAGMVSVVHAFAIRDDYLVRLERRIHESDEVGSQGPPTTREDTETVSEVPTEPPPETPPAPPSEGTAQPTSRQEPGPSRKAPDMMAPSEAREQAPVREPGMPAGHSAGVEPFSMTARIADTYPLPIAYSWSLLQGIWDPRDRYLEQLRHAENMLAFLGSISLAILDQEDYERAQLDLKLPWQGGISFGAWKLIVQRSAKVFQTYENNPLASDIRKLRIESENKGLART
jgi:hypothetical protein